MPPPDPPLLYAIAMNQLKDCLNITVAAFEGNDAIAMPTHFAGTPVKLLELMMARAPSSQDSEDLGG
jgi:hypothetical protein